jgi:hypothetical protein
MLAKGVLADESRSALARLFAAQILVGAPGLAKASMMGAGDLPAITAQSLGA